MHPPGKKFSSIDEYHSTFPENIRKLLDEMRATIKAAAPLAKEVISYNMPAFEQNGILVYYAGYKNHIGFYPTSFPIQKFEKELTGYKTSKGAIQFPIANGIPRQLVTMITYYRVKENGG